MRILLDTHIALWAVADTGKLSKEVFQLLETGKNEIYYSVAFVWEVAIKHYVRPEQMPIFMVKTLKRSADAAKHNDPFDRILLSQAKCENMTLLTHDSLSPYYGEGYAKCV